MANLLDVVREKFFSQLQSQTNWGRNQLISMYNEIQRDVLSSTITNEEVLKRWENLADGKPEIPTGYGKKKPQQGIYNPRGTQNYDQNESPSPDFEGNPFKDDDEIDDIKNKPDGK